MKIKVLENMSNLCTLEAEDKKYPNMSFIYSKYILHVAFFLPCVYSMAIFASVFTIF